jgi:hypothetical protein
MFPWEAIYPTLRDRCDGAAPDEGSATGTIAILIR